MTDYNLPENYTDNPEALLRKNRSRTACSFTTPLASEPVTPVPSATTAMAKILRDYSTPAIANVRITSAVNTGIGDFELCIGLITMCRQTNSMVCPARKQVHTCNNSLSCAIP